MHTSTFYTIPLGLCLRVSDVVPNPLTILLINVYVTYYICMGAAESFHLYSSLTDDASDAISEDRILQDRKRVEWPAKSPARAQGQIKLDCHGPVFRHANPI